MKDTIKTARRIKTAGFIRPACAGTKVLPFFYGARMVTLSANCGAASETVSKRFKNVTNNLRFYNQVIVKLSLNQSVKAYGNAAAFHGHAPDVRTFTQNLIDRELRREMDSEIAIMARGENIAANQRRQRMLGKYLLSKPYCVIKNFYGVQMQKLSSDIPAGVRQEDNVFYSDIVHERVDKTIYSPAQTQIERVDVPHTPLAAISGADMNRIATQAARQVEKKMRTERERNGKW